MSFYRIHLITLLTMLFFGSGREAMSQTHLVVIDKETGEPVNKATVVTNKGESVVSTKMGHVTLNNSFESLTINHISFLQRKMDKKEVSDTIWLLPKAIHLREVVVYGEDRPLIKNVVKDAVKDAALYAPPSQAIATFDFFSMFEKKPLNKKARKRNKEILENWDKDYNDQKGELPTKP